MIFVPFFFVYFPSFISVVFIFLFIPLVLSVAFKACIFLFSLVTPLLTFAIFTFAASFFLRVLSIFSALALTLFVFVPPKIIHVFSLIIIPFVFSYLPQQYSLIYAYPLQETLSFLQFLSPKQKQAWQVPGHYPYWLDEYFGYDEFWMQSFCCQC